MAGRSGQMYQCSGFQPLVYIVCVLASSLLYWVRMFSGLGIRVAPRLSTFWVNLGGISRFSFFIPREEVLFIIVLPLWFHQCCNVYSQNVPVYRMTRANMPPPENPILAEAVASVAQGTTAIMQLLQDQNTQRNE